jgi:hypothetical protein
MVDTTSAPAEASLAETQPARSTSSAPFRRSIVHAVWRDLDALLQKELEDRELPSPFYRNFFATVGHTKDDFDDFVNSMQKSFENSLLNAFRNPTTGVAVPPITHKVWLTAPDTPALPPDDYIIHYLNMIERLPADTTHYFWTNNAFVKNDLTRQIAAKGLHNILVADINVFAGELLFSNVANLIAARKYVLAADLVKIIVLDRFGGVYSDLGVLFDRHVWDLIGLADYAFIYGGKAFFQLSFLACCPRSDLTTLFKGILTCPEAFGQSYGLLGSTPTAIDEVNIFSGLGFTLCAYLFPPTTSRVLVLPSQSRNHSWRAQQSWYGNQPKHGNVVVGQTPPTIIDADKFAESEQRLAGRLTTQGMNGLLRERLRLLIALSDYFRHTATHFCRIFYFNDCARALGWHNYSYLYNYVIGSSGNPVRAMLEISAEREGVNPDADALGVSGGSLNAWKELLPDTTARGVRIAAVDRVRDAASSLGQWFERAILTRRGCAGEPAFDLIVDSGLHAFQVNRDLLEIGHKYLSENGVYIIEDVPEGDVGAWTRSLAAFPHESAIVDLPHTSGAKDNRLVLVTKRARPRV